MNFAKEELRDILRQECNLGRNAVQFSKNVVGKLENEATSQIN